MQLYIVIVGFFIACYAGREMYIRITAIVYKFVFLKFQFLKSISLSIKVLN